MTLPEIIKSRGLKKEYIIEKSGVPRNKFYCYQKKIHKFSDKELSQLALAIGIEKQTLIDLALR